MCVPQVPRIRPGSCGQLGQAGGSGKLRLAPERLDPERVGGRPNHAFHLHHLQRVKSIYRWWGSGAMRAGYVLPPGDRPRMCERYGMRVPLVEGLGGRGSAGREAPARRGPERVPGRPNHTFHLHHLQRVKSIYRWRGSARHASRGRPSHPVTGQECAGRQVGLECVSRW